MAVVMQVLSQAATNMSLLIQFVSGYSPDNSSNKKSDGWVWISSSRRSSLVSGSLPGLAELAALSLPLYDKPVSSFSANGEHLQCKQKALSRTPGGFLINANDWR